MNTYKGPIKRLLLPPEPRLTARENPLEYSRRIVERENRRKGRSQLSNERSEGENR